MDQIKVGAALIIYQDNKVLLGYRLSTHGHGSWAFPGGHVEFGETPEQAVIREAAEETGLVIETIEKVGFTNDIYDNGKQYITLFFKALAWSGNVDNLEPHKCEQWKWFLSEDLPEPLFTPISTLFKEGYLLS